ncbi:MAG TPA: hypothetical protein PLD92_04240, partial [Candidatus Omnitrophota bacterium]|nr:hypothetical protein [Candidatus Omnitrophota bacterium]
RGVATIMANLQPALGDALESLAARPAFFWPARGAGAWNDRPRITLTRGLKNGWGVRTRT